MLTNSGLCLLLLMAMIEFSANVLGYEDSTATAFGLTVSFNKTIFLMAWRDVTE